MGIYLSINAPLSTKQTIRQHCMASAGPRRRRSAPRLPERKESDDWIEDFASFTINIESPKLSRYQRKHYADVLSTSDIASYRVVRSSLSLTFEDGKRIQFHRSLLPQIIALVDRGAGTDEFTLANVTLLKDLDSKI